MKKYLKAIFLIISFIILSVIIDIFFILKINRPIFAIRVDEGDSINIVYKGLFYDTYNCAEYSMALIKSKGTKFNCSISIGEVIEIVDTTKQMKNFLCSEALESFYEDETYNFYWSCIKNDYIIVKYSSGYEEPVSQSLKNGKITINDLKKYDIDYIKQKK